MDFRPDRDLILMQIAELIALRGTCSRARVGAVIAHEGRILVTGYNGAPSGMPHCDHTPEVTYLFKTGEPIQKTTPGCITAIHAEANAIAWAARHGIKIEDAEVFTTMAPCLPCAQLLINTGIIRVTYKHQYRKTEGIDMLQAAGIEVRITE